MTRFFFDYTAKDRSLLDYLGDEFRSPQAAVDYAETIAENLKHSLTEDWTGWSIDVRNAQGTRLFSVGVDTAGLMAA